ncbi:DNA topoisomerase 3-alpha, partial [Durusdinium trenchii]
MPVRVLNVAEKPSVAREITRHLGGPNISRRHCHGSLVTEFPFTLRQTHCKMLVTAVRGHLLEADFVPQYKVWKASNPVSLFQAPVERKAIPGSEELERMLHELARQCQWLVLWLDCDREGEAIAFEVIETCQRAAGEHLQVFRAVFSALTHVDLNNACRTLRAPDRRLADAVEARQMFDLRAGSAFTRWMSLRYQAMFPELSGETLSYGPCQFPTLGFVVERFLRIQRFVPEPFWSIKAEVQKDGRVIPFGWRRGRLFDRLAVLALFELVVEEAPNGATVVNISEEPKTRWRPLPLNTVEMTKMAASKLRMSPQRCMHVVEELYQRGFISYPRTETDRFHPTIDVRNLVQTQSASSIWGPFAATLLAGRFTPPRAGSNDDHAHPPIHPVHCCERGELTDESWRVYELVARHFLACCSPDARGSRTEVEIVCGGESFVKAGVVVHDRGWLDVYPYANWVEDVLPHFSINEVLAFSTLEMTESMTQPPQLLSEAELIGIMDREKIGTDATMHDHIQKIQTRTYAIKNADGRLQPSRLGIALVEGYQRFAVEEGMDLSKPVLRASMERGMEEIAQGRLQREDFLREALDIAQRCYSALERNAPALDHALSQSFTGRTELGRQAPVLQANFSSCRCGATLELRCHTIAGDGGGRADGAGGAGKGGKGRGRARGRARGGRGARAARGRGARGARGGRAGAAGAAGAGRESRSERF